MDKLILRPEIPAQYREMEELIRDAFFDRYCPGCSEHFIVHRMRSAPELVPELCLAAAENERLAGGIWYAKASVRAGAASGCVLTLGPVCVAPERQSHGIGAALIRRTLTLARDAGSYPAVILYGDLAYYGRFGFRPAADFGITDADGNCCPALLVYPLADRIPRGAFDEGPIYHATPEEVRRFDRTFPLRQQHYRSGQLFFFPPTPPPNEPRLKKAWELRQQGAKMLRDAKILEAWESIGGKVRGVGSFRSDLMQKHRDVDLHIYTEHLEVSRTLEALRPILADRRTLGLTYVNGADTDERCLEWHLTRQDEAGNPWKFDMIQILSGSKYDGVMENVAEAVLAAATPENRRTILELKNARPESSGISGIEICRAVLSGGVTSYQELLTWRNSHPPVGPGEWMPDVPADV